MKKLIATTLGLSFSVSALAASSTINSITTNTANIYQNLKESPAGLYIGHESITKRDKTNKRIRGYESYMYTDLSYAITDKDKVVVGATHTYSQRPDEEFEGINTIDSRLQYDRKIVSQAQAGVNIQTSICYYQETVPKTKNFEGYGQFRLYVDRTLTNRLSLSGQARVYQFNRLSGADNTLNRQYRAYITPAYSITDKLTASITGVYYKYDNVGEIDSQKILIKPALGYAFNNTFSVNGYADFIPYTGRSLEAQSQLFNDITFGLVLNAAVF
ncbi:MAG: hypothetical protein ACOCUH_02540 [Bacteriovoracia bacterium]